MRTEVRRDGDPPLHGLIHAPARLLADRNLTHDAERVLLAICALANEDNDGWWQWNDRRLRELTGFSGDALALACHHLLERHYLQQQGSYVRVIYDVE